MQNPNDGTLEEISKETYDKLVEAEKAGNNEALKEALKKTLGTFKDGSPVRAGVAKFRVGEVVEVNGGFFKVRKITKRDIILRGIPKPKDK